MAKFLAGFLLFGYLAGAGAIALIDQSQHPERSLVSSLGEGLAWPGLVLRIIQQP